MGLHVDRTVVMDLIEAKYQTVDHFITAWADTQPGREDGKALSRDRSAVYRWLANGMPSNWEVVLSFCAMLDTDLSAILDISRSRLRERFAVLRLAMQMGLNGAVAYRPIFETLSPGPAWPSPLVASRFYGRFWHTHDFYHDGQANLNQYVALRLYPKSTHRPLAFHVAYRQKDAPDGLFRPFGVVRVLNSQVELVSENGRFPPPVDFGDCAVFETFFGPEACAFRVASLHPFDLTLTAPSDAEGGLRFKG